MIGIRSVVWNLNLMMNYIRQNARRCRYVCMIFELIFLEFHTMYEWIPEQFQKRLCANCKLLESKWILFYLFRFTQTYDSNITHEEQYKLLLWNVFAWFSCPNLFIHSGGWILVRLEERLCGWHHFRNTHSILENILL